ncbi:MAG: hypothetical protein ABSE39_04640 [Candidatus Bathyarchaeia archaeon]|jgi:hypothetical protein
MPSAGDIDRTHDFDLLYVSKNATAAIAKGNIVSLKDGRPWQSGDTGPFGVANQAVASGADMKGKIIVDGVVWVAAGGAITQFSSVVPSDVDEVSEQDGYSVTVSGATGTGALLLSLMAYDAAVNDGDLIRIDL